MKIYTHPSWQFSLDDKERIDPMLLQLLKHIQHDEKLTHAANLAGISYRHAWNIINKWNKRFGQPLVSQQKGRGTTLTVLGKKLVWAEQLIEAHLTPQIENLTSLINAEIDKVLGESSLGLTIHASHGYAVALLPDLIRQYTKHKASIKFTGSVEAVRSLAIEQCELAGFHLARHPLITPQIVKAYAPYLYPHRHVIIRMVTREQGFIVAKGNPKNILFFNDLIRPDVRFISRQQSAGTRVLFDAFLSLCKISSNNVTGYKNEEYTHAAIAAHVASGSADVGFGIKYAARKFELDFIPMVSEQYVLACNKDWLNTKLGIELIDILKSQDFADQVDALPGYCLDSPGEVIPLNKFL